MPDTDAHIYDRVARAYQIARVLVYDKHPRGVPDRALLTPQQQAALEHLARAEHSLTTLRRERLMHDLATS